MTTAPSPIKRQRADAQMNRLALLAAATRVFGRHGFDAPLELIAAEAGISRTSLYRHFPDREALGFAIFDRNVLELETQARAVEARPDGFLVLLELLMAHFVNSSGLADALASQSGPAARIAELRVRVVDALTPALRRAQQAGLIRDHLQPDDLHLMMDIFGGALVRGGPELREQLARKTLRIVCDGMRSS